MKSLIDRIVQRLLHFQCSLDSGRSTRLSTSRFFLLRVSCCMSSDINSLALSLIHCTRLSRLVHLRKRHTLIDETFTKTTTTTREYEVEEAAKCVRPYFLIRPQTALVLPNETGKFKCCFGGEPLPTIVWSHNESRLPELLPVDAGAMSTRYRTHKLHDIHYLDIGPITERDHGQIKCSIVNRFGREEVMVELLVVGE